MILYLHRYFLTKDLNETDALIYIDDPTHMEEIAYWEGHTKELNMVKKADKSGWTLHQMENGGKVRSFDLKDNSK